MDDESSEEIVGIADLFIRESLKIGSEIIKSKYDSQNIAMNILTISLSKFVFMYVKKEKRAKVIEKLHEQIISNIQKMEFSMPVEPY